MSDGLFAYKSSERLNFALPKRKREEGFRLTAYAAKILEVLASSNVPLGVSELLERTGLNRRTMFWWLARLVDKGYVQRIGRKRCPGTVYAITWEGLRLLAFYRSNFERVKKHLQTTVAGRSRLLLGDGGGSFRFGGGDGDNVVSDAAVGVGVDAAGGVSSSGVAAVSSVAGFGVGGGNGGVVWERAALCVYRRGRWVPVVGLGLVNASGLVSQLAAGGGGGGRVGRVPWWVVADGGRGFREVGFRASYRRLRRLFRLLGVELPKRVKRVTVYAKGKEVHVDAATLMPLDEIVTVGSYGARKQYLLAFAGAALALLAAGFDKRFLQLVVAMLEPA
jgi:DNA-binding MarR family transcriptional regulator